MKKYRLTLNSLLDVLHFFDVQGCDVCPLKDKAIGSKSCYEYCQTHPEEAAALIGYEIIEVESKLTEQELAICKAVGAKWVSRNELGDTVSLWESKPVLFPEAKRCYYSNGKFIACMPLKLFPSLNSGDLVNVEELLKEAKA